MGPRLHMQTLSVGEFSWLYLWQGGFHYLQERTRTVWETHTRSPPATPEGVCPTHSDVLWATQRPAGGTRVGSLPGYGGG